MSENQKNGTNGVVPTDSPKNSLKKHSPKKNPSTVEPVEKSKLVVNVEEVEVQSSPKQEPKPSILREMCHRDKEVTHRRPSVQPPNLEEWKKRKEDEEFGKDPLQKSCPKCKNEISTRIDYKAGMCTKIWCGLLCLIPIFGQAGGCLLPYCFKWSRDRRHICPKCKHVLHTRAATIDNGGCCGCQ